MAFKKALHVHAVSFQDQYHRQKAMAKHSKATMEGYLRCVESPTLDDLARRKSELPDSVAAVLAMTPDAQQYPVACPGLCGTGKKSSNPTESLNKVHMLARLLHEGACLKEFVAREGARYISTQKEAMGCVGVLPPRVMLKFALAEESAAKVTVPSYNLTVTTLDSCCYRVVLF